MCMTTDWLAFLDARFPECNPGEPFTPATYSFARPEHEHLAFLFEFFQKVPSLKVYPSGLGRVREPNIDLTIFRALTSLHLVKIDCRGVMGIQTLRSQLRNVRLQRSTVSLSEFFATCAGDRVEARRPWSMQTTPS